MDESREWYVPSPLPGPAKAERETLSEPAEGEAHRRLREGCGFYLLLAAAVGMAYAVLFVNAPSPGLSAPVYALVWCVCAHLAARRLGKAELRRDGFWFGGILLLDLVILWTANEFVQFVSAAGAVLLQCFWLLNLFADIREWHFDKAAGAVLRLCLRTVGRCWEPFAHLLARRKKPGGRGRYILLGLLIAAPMAAAVLALLSSADAVFSSLWGRIAVWEGLGNALGRLGGFLLAAVLFYGGLCAQTDRPESTEQKDARQADTLVAVTFTAVLAAIYAVFCAVQLVMLFRTDGSGLPEGYTYAQYAREGFFQLLLVGAINVLLVIVSQRRFRTSRALRFLLTFISVCTWGMLLSSARRMLLYVQVYGFTFLRLLVLWFLLVLALVLTGAAATVYRPRFRLFRFTLTVCLAAWLIFAFARPDALAARYDLRRFGCGDTALSLIRYELSDDAVAELRPYLDTDREAIEKYMDGYLDKGIPRKAEEAGLRGFNVSLWQANKTAEVFENGK